MIWIVTSEHLMTGGLAGVDGVFSDRDRAFDEAQDRLASVPDGNWQVIITGRTLDLAVGEAPKEEHFLLCKPDVDEARSNAKAGMVKREFEVTYDQQRFREEAVIADWGVLVNNHQDGVTVCVLAEKPEQAAALLRQAAAAIEAKA